MKRKSQIAMESLMVYGIAILIVMLAIGALIYFGVLDLGSYLPDKCSLPGSIKCENYLITASDTAGQVQIELRNTVGKNIAVRYVNFTGTDDWDGVRCDYEPTAGSDPLQNYGAGTAADPYRVRINNGDVQKFTVKCGATLKAIASGKKVKGKVDVFYNVIGSSIYQRLTGDLQAKATS